MRTDGGDVGNDCASGCDAAKTCVDPPNMTQNKKMFFSSLSDPPEDREEDMHEQSEQHDGQEENEEEAQGIYEGAAADDASICKSLWGASAAASALPLAHGDFKAFAE